MRNAAEARGVILPDTLMNVEREYVGGYGKDIPQDRVSIVNVCIDRELRGIGIGKVLLDFIKARKGEGCSSFELCVLEANKNAVALYEKIGFSVVGRAAFQPTTGSSPD